MGVWPERAWLQVGVLGLSLCHPCPGRVTWSSMSAAPEPEAVVRGGGCGSGMTAHRHPPDTQLGESHRAGVRAVGICSPSRGSASLCRSGSSAMQAGGGVHVAGTGSSAWTACLEKGGSTCGDSAPLLHSCASRATGPGPTSLSPNLTSTLQNHLDVKRPNGLPNSQNPGQHENIRLHVQTSLISRWQHSKPGPVGPHRWRACKASPVRVHGLLARVVGEGMVKDSGPSVCTWVPPLLVLWLWTGRLVPLGLSLLTVKWE